MGINTRDRSRVNCALNRAFFLMLTSIEICYFSEAWYLLGMGITAEGGGEGRGTRSPRFRILEGTSPRNRDFSRKFSENLPKLLDLQIFSKQSDQNSRRNQNLEAGGFDATEFVSPSQNFVATPLLLRVRFCPSHRLVMWEVLLFLLWNAYLSCNNAVIQLMKWR